MSKPLRHSTDTIINSYNEHEFVVKFADTKRIGEISFAKLSTAETTTVSFNESSGKFSIAQVTKLDELVSELEVAMNKCKSGSKTDVKCVAQEALQKHIELEKRYTQMVKFRDRISNRLRNLTCADPKMETSKPINTERITIGRRNYVMNDLFENDHALIFTVEDFITEDECQILMKHGKPRLSRATVAAEDGTSIVSNHRKANQAIYTLGENDPLQ